MSYAEAVSGRSVSIIVGERVSEDARPKKSNNFSTSGKQQAAKIAKSRRKKQPKSQKIARKSNNKETALADLINNPKIKSICFDERGMPTGSENGSVATRPAEAPPSPASKKMVEAIALLPTPSSVAKARVQSRQKGTLKLNPRANPSPPHPQPLASDCGLSGSSKSTAGSIGEDDGELVEGGNKKRPAFDVSRLPDHVLYLILMEAQGHRGSPGRTLASLLSKDLVRVNKAYCVTELTISIDLSEVNMRTLLRRYSNLDRLTLQKSTHLPGDFWKMLKRTSPWHAKKAKKSPLPVKRQSKLEFSKLSSAASAALDERDDVTESSSSSSPPSATRHDIGDLEGDIRRMVLKTSSDDGDADSSTSQSESSDSPLSLSARANAAGYADTEEWQKERASDARIFATMKKLEIGTSFNALRVLTLADNYSLSSEDLGNSLRKLTRDSALVSLSLADMRGLRDTSFLQRLYRKTSDKLQLIAFDHCSNLVAREEDFCALRGLKAFAAPSCPSLDANGALFALSQNSPNLQRLELPQCSEWLCDDDLLWMRCMHNLTWLDLADNPSLTTAALVFLTYASRAKIQSFLGSCAAPPLNPPSLLEPGTNEDDVEPSGGPRGAAAPLSFKEAVEQGIVPTTHDEDMEQCPMPSICPVNMLKLTRCTGVEAVDLLDFCRLPLLSELRLTGCTLYINYHDLDAKYHDLCVGALSYFPLALEKGEHMEKFKPWATALALDEGFGDTPLQALTEAYLPELSCESLFIGSARGDHRDKSAGKISSTRWPIETGDKRRKEIAGRYILLFLKHCARNTRTLVMQCSMLANVYSCAYAAFWMRSLQVLDLGHCPYVGTRTVEQLAAVLCVTRATDPTASNLRELRLDGCEVDNSAMRALFTVPPRELLLRVAAQERVDALYPSLRPVAHELIMLSLNGCARLTNGAFRNIDAVPQLGRLEVSRCESLNDTFTRTLAAANLEKLSFLDLSHTAVQSQTFSTHLPELKALRTLIVDGVGKNKPSVLREIQTYALVNRGVHIMSYERGS